MNLFHLVVLLFMTQTFISCVTGMFLFQEGGSPGKNNEEPI